MASRIYNEKPSADGVPTFDAAPPNPPSMQSTPVAIPEHMGSLPFSVTSMPHAAPFAPEMPSSADAPQKTVAPQQFAHWPSVAPASESAPKAFSPSLPEGA